MIKRGKYISRRCLSVYRKTKQKETKPRTHLAFCTISGTPVKVAPEVQSQTISAGISCYCEMLIKECEEACFLPGIPLVHCILAENAKADYQSRLCLATSTTFFFCVMKVMCDQLVISITIVNGEYVITLFVCLSVQDVL